MKAVILAAGVGRRLSEHIDKPKSLLEFNGRSLMQRHLDNLASLGIEDISLCLGYEQEKILASINPPSSVNLSYRYNPDFREGSMISLFTMREEFNGPGDTLLMDADVLYDKQILSKLVKSKRTDLLLIDRDFEPGDEPVKICLRDGQIVEFRKNLNNDLLYDAIGESVGFFRFSPLMGQRLVGYAKSYLKEGNRDMPCEEAIRDTVLAHADTFHACDVSGLPWIEIDFPEDIEKAEQVILPAVDDM
ncbi:MAG: phosphocholine cytidylyltransferase family protein [Pseudomonadota bacterium]